MRSPHTNQPVSLQREACLSPSRHAVHTHTHALTVSLSLGNILGVLTRVPVGRLPPGVSRGDRNCRSAVWMGSIQGLQTLPVLGVLSRPLPIPLLP